MTKLKDFAFRYMLEISGAAAVASIAGLSALAVSNPDVIVVCMFAAAFAYFIGFFHGLTAEMARTKRDQ